MRLEEYDPEWKLKYQEEKEYILTLISNYIVDIQHVGSTSIEGLVSKPIIDIAIGVSSLDQGRKCIKVLEEIGYEFKGEAGVVGRLFFSKGDASNKTHHVHIVEINGDNWMNQILFRDYLRQHQTVKDEYTELKRALAQVYGNDRGTYTARKTSFITDVIRKAKEHEENGKE